MSNKKKSYNKMYNAEDQQVVSETVEDAVVETAETIETVEATVKVDKPKFTTGIVVGCTKLNVRENPDMTGNILCELMVSSKVKVNIANKYDDWFHVRTDAGVEGYCMKKYISTKR